MLTSSKDGFIIRNFEWSSSIQTAFSWAAPDPTALAADGSVEFRVIAGIGLGADGSVDIRVMTGSMLAADGSVDIRVMACPALAADGSVDIRLMAGSMLAADGPVDIRVVAYPALAADGSVDTLAMPAVLTEAGSIRHAGWPPQCSPRTAQSTSAEETLRARPRGAPPRLSSIFQSTRADDLTLATAVSHSSNLALAADGSVDIHMRRNLPRCAPSSPERRRSVRELAGHPLGAGEDAVPGPGAREVPVARGVVPCARDMRSAAKTPRTGGQDGPR